MPLELISVGGTANDGTGDPPRVAGQKINANFEELYQALEATETQAQLDTRDTANRDRANHTGTQTAATIADFGTAAAAAAPVQSVAGRDGAVTLTKADVGLSNVDNTADADKPISTATGNALTSLAAETQAALDLKLESAAIDAFETATQLNARDTANRDRANHTGTQPASTITGLAVVASSGAYADLSGQPIVPFGFTYDQQAEPVGPVAGVTWRERSAEGLIVGEWQWDGTYWEKPETESVSILGWITQLTVTTGFYGNPIGSAFKLLGHRLNASLAATPQTGPDYWTFVGLNGLTVFDTRNLPGITEFNSSSFLSMLAVPFVWTAPTDGGQSTTLTQALRFGSAGLIRRGHFIALYRRIRV